MEPYRLQEGSVERIQLLCLKLIAESKFWQIKLASTSIMTVVATFKQNLDQKIFSFFSNNQFSSGWSFSWSYLWDSLASRFEIDPKRAKLLTTNNCCLCNNISKVLTVTNISVELTDVITNSGMMHLSCHFIMSLSLGGLAMFVAVQHPGEK